MSEGSVRQPDGSEQVGPYRLESRLGAGGMGEVFRAWDTHNERWVALKHVQSRPTVQPDASQRLRREAKLAASLSHPAVVEIYEAFENDQGLWLVMELVEGCGLDVHLRQGELTLGTAMRLARDISEGLAAAHELKIVHRDLKTENIVVSPEGRAKILDFGLAKRLFTGSEEATASISLSVSGALLGTGRAMSPEQAMGDSVGPSSDLFSLGSLLFEMLTGHPPFKGASFIHTLSQVCTYQPPPVRELNARVPEDLSILVERLLEKNAADRPASAAEVVGLLAEIAERILPEDGGVNLLQGVDPSPLKRNPRRGREPSHPRDTGIFVRTLVATELAITPAHGASAGFGGWRRRDAEAETVRQAERLARELLASFRGLEIASGSSALWLFERPVEAVRFAEAFQRRLREISIGSEGVLAARIGIHLGEVFLRPNNYGDVTRGARPLEVEGLAKRLARGLMRLAEPGRILLSQGAYELAHRILSTEAAGALRWIHRGGYSFERLNQNLQVVEVLAGDGEIPPTPSGGDGIRQLVDGAPMWRRAVVPAAAALVILTAAIGLRWTSLEHPTAAAAPGEPVAPSVAVLPIHDLSPLEEGKWIPVAIAELLTTALAAPMDLRWTPAERTAWISRRFELPASDTLAEDTLQRLAACLEADFVISGSVVRLEGGNLVLKVDLQETEAGGGQAYSVSRQGSEDDLVEAVLGLADGLRHGMGRAPLSLEQAQAVESVFPVGQAAPYYYAGLVDLRARRLVAAREKFEKAVAHDPEHALSYSALYTLWEGLGDAERAGAAADSASQLAALLPPLEAARLEAARAESEEDWAKAAASYAAWWNRVPGQLDVGNALVRAELARKDLGAEAAIVSAAKRLQVMRDLPARLSSSPWVDLAEAEIAQAQQRDDLILVSANRALRKARDRQIPDALALAQYHRAAALKRRGRAAEALSAIDEALSVLTEIGDREIVLEAFGIRAALLYAIGQPEQGRELFQQVEHLRQTPGSSFLEISEPVQPLAPSPEPRLN